MIDCAALPAAASTDCIYRLVPQNATDEFYDERTDRNIGWVTRKEQRMFRRCVVGIAGCGGMGGQIGAIMVRLGIGETRIGDPEVFDASNMNRQYAAGRATIGKSKALETATKIRADVSDDTTLVVYPRGIQADTAESFVRGCDIVLDEIEFWAVGARLHLHAAARKHGVPVLNCNTVGHGTRLFRFGPLGRSVAKMLGYTQAEADRVQRRIRDGSATKAEVEECAIKVFSFLVPELPEYSADPVRWSTVRNGLARIIRERRAMIITPNPVMATGFVCNHVVFELIRRKSSLKRIYPVPPPAPGYIYFDCGIDPRPSDGRKKAGRYKHPYRFVARTKVKLIELPADLRASL